MAKVWVTQYGLEQATPLKVCPKRIKVKLASGQVRWVDKRYVRPCFGGA